MGVIFISDIMYFKTKLTEGLILPRSRILVVMRLHGLKPAFLWAPIIRDASFAALFLFNLTLQAIVIGTWVGRA